MVVESELEEKVLSALEDAFGSDLSPARFADGGANFLAGETTWRIEPQVDVSDLATIGSIADFVVTGIKGPGLDRRLVIECDGAAFHVQPTSLRARVRKDITKRLAIIGRPGWQVVTLTWNDVTKNKPSGELPAGIRAPKVWSAMWDRIKAQVDNPRLAGLPSMSPFELLCRYLEHPTDDWTTAAGALLTASIIQCGQRKQLADPPSYHRVVDQLRYTPEPFPLPPMAVAKRTGKRDLLGQVVREGHMAFAASGVGGALAALDPQRLDVLLRLDDQHPARKDEGFNLSWRTYLHALNVLQFLPRLEAVTSEQLSDHIAEEEPDASILGMIAVDELDIPLDAEAPADARPSLDDLLAACFDAEVEALAKAVYEAKLPMPDIPPVELPGDGGAPTELSWEALKVAICVEDAVEQEDLSTASRDGWTVLLMPVGFGRVRQALDDR